LYLQTLGKHGLAGEARAKLSPLIVKRLNAGEGESGKEFESLKPLIRSLAESFESQPPKGGTTNVIGTASAIHQATYLRQIAEAVSANVALPEMVIRERLVKNDQFAPFYELLVKRSAGFAGWESNSDFADHVKTHPLWSVEEIEEALDHAGNSRGEVRESARLAWQKEFVDYLLVERRNSEATLVIATIEQELKGRFARPAWLRLAKLRLEVRAGRAPQAVVGLKRFAGVEVSEKLEKVSPPNLERLNQAVEMLRREQRTAEADELLRATYERQLALEQLTEAPFIGLARLAFAKNDSAGGLKLLKLMLDLGWSATSSQAAAELAVLPTVKSRAVESSRIETPTASNQLVLVQSLRLAAETAAEFGEFATAIEYRQRLLELSPEDSVCRLELARLLAANKREAEAVNLLAALIAERRIARQTRWTALWIAPEVTGKRGDLWQSLVKQSGKDGETVAALEALSLVNRAQFGEAAKSLNDASAKCPSNELKLLRALLLKHSGQEREALIAFNASLIPLSDSAALAAFGAGNSSEDELRWQLVRLFARLNQPGAALKTAAADERLRGSTAVNAEEVSLSVVAPKFQTLAVYAAERKTKSRLELLALLSSSAEQLGEFNKAAEFERARLASLSGDDRRKAEASVERLNAKQQEKANKRGLALTVDDRPVSVQ
jgi:predicted Zn-dependent protease